MEKILKDHLKEITIGLSDQWTNYHYHEDVNEDAINGDAWLENRTSYIYKVGVLCAIDANKCDWVHVVIGTQRMDTSGVKIIGTLYFEEGENDDMGRVMARVNKILEWIHPAFEGAVGV